MTVELDVCPMCCAPAEFGVCEPGVEEHPNDGGRFITCTNAACQTCSILMWGEDVEKQLAEKWNRRTAQKNAVIVAYETCEKLAEKRGCASCEIGQYDSETGATECSKQDRGDCSCGDFDDLSVEIHEAKKKAIAQW